MRILIDNGILIHSQFLEPATRQSPPSSTWGEMPPVHGFLRRVPKDNEQRIQANALFTVGRLIREGKIEAFTYSELLFEKARSHVSLFPGSALYGCKIAKCPPAIVRSKFQTLTKIPEMINKGGREDRKRGIPPGEFNQVAFCKMLQALTPEEVAVWIAHSEQLGFTPFELDSLRDLGRFQAFCKRSGGENYPDILHYWTADRNGLDALLTLDGDIPKLLMRIRGEKHKQVDIRLPAWRPLELLEALGILEPDPVPFEVGRFYEIPELLK